MKTSLNEEMRIYLKDVAQRKVLTREQEIALFKRLSEGCDTARAEIVEANLRFVIKLALQYSGRGVPLADLIQEGNIGLLEVVAKFDYKRGYRFSTYAAFWIRQSIQMALRKQSNVIRLPIRKSRMLGHLNEAISNFTHANGRHPTTGELARVVDMDETKLEHLMQLRDSVLSLDVEPDEEGSQLLHRLIDEKTPTALEYSIEHEQQKQVARVLDMLSEKERNILKLRFGFNGEGNLSLRHTSKLVGMSQEGVRRIERSALKKLRRTQASELVAGYV